VGVGVIFHQTYFVICQVFFSSDLNPPLSSYLFKEKRQHTYRSLKEITTIYGSIKKNKQSGIDSCIDMFDRAASDEPNDLQCFFIPNRAREQ
jgi:hypothetical protein